MTDTARSHVGLLCLGALLALPSCVQGPRIIIAPGEEGAEITRSYWIRYENWRISSNDAIRKLDNAKTSRKSCVVSMGILQRDFVGLEPHVPADRLATFERIRSEYQRVRELTEKEVNRDILRQTLRGLARQVKENFDPASQLEESESSEV